MVKCRKSERKASELTYFCAIIRAHFAADRSICMHWLQPCRLFFLIKQKSVGFGGEFRPWGLAPLTDYKKAAQIGRAALVNSASRKKASRRVFNCLARFIPKELPKPFMLIGEARSVSQQSPYPPPIQEPGRETADRGYAMPIGSAHRLQSQGVRRSPPWWLHCLARPL